MSELKTPEPQVTITYRRNKIICEVFTWNGVWHWKIIYRPEETRCERKGTRGGSRWQKTEMEEVPDTTLTAVLAALYHLHGVNAVVRLLLLNEQERRALHAPDNA